MKFFLFMIGLVIFLLYNPTMVEGFKPNEDQFLICNDKLSKGETNYVKDKNKILGPLQGFYSSIIKLTEEKKNHQYYKSPNCISSKKIKNNYFNDNKVIDHSKNNWKPPLDPFDKFAKPDNNDSILYPDNYLEDMINQHETHNQNKILNRK